MSWRKTAEVPGRGRKRPMTPQEKRNLRWGLIFTSPGLIGILVFQLYPIITSFFLSFTSATMLTSPAWIGLDNYRAMLEDDQWWKSLSNTAWYIVLAIPFGIVVALGLALLLNTKVRGQSFYRVIFYLPAIVPMVASSVVWLYIFNAQFGMLNSILNPILEPFGLAPPGWLDDPNQPLGFGPSWAMIGIIMFTTWGAGNLMIIMLAGLQDVPRDLTDQAMVDGAGPFHRFRHVTVPFLSPHLLFAMITGLIAGFQFFTPIFVLTNGQPGPDSSLLVSGLYMFMNAFQFFKVGYASAIAWVLFIIMGLATVLIFRLVGRRVYYTAA